MTLHRMFDASVPPARAYPGCAAVAGYIGGATPHVWTLPEWERFSAYRQLPIWVKAGSGTPLSQARQAATKAAGMGWRPFATHRRWIVLDMETWDDPPFVSDFAVTLHKQGFGCLVYGSASSVYGNPHADGYWVADWDGIPTLENFPDIKIHQYADNVPWDGGAVDLSVLPDDALLHLGRGPRRLVP